MSTRILRLALLALLVSLSLATFPTGTVAAKPHAPALASGNGTMQEMGFDTCALPSTSDMQNFWNGTPLWWYNVYIGGENYGCRPATVTASWLNTVKNEGWNFLFNWVGLQAPCSTQNVSTFSTNTTTAYQQGASDAASAYSALLNLGLTNNAQGTSVVFDLDSAPDQNNPTCLAATNAFIQGWVDTLHVQPAQVAGVYGAVCGSNLVALASLKTPPDFIWGADWNGNPSTSDLYAGGCGVPSGDWVNHQRFKQYQGDHWQTYGNSKLMIDSDCANGPTSPNGAGTNNSCL